MLHSVTQYIHYSIEIDLLNQYIISVPMTHVMLGLNYNKDITQRIGLPKKVTIYSNTYKNL